VPRLRWNEIQNRAFPYAAWWIGRTGRSAGNEWLGRHKVGSPTNALKGEHDRELAYVQWRGGHPSRDEIPPLRCAVRGEIRPVPLRSG
jgi:hypothetical protein